MTTMTKQEKMNHDLIGMAYQPYKVRKALTKEQRQRVAKAVSNYNFNNHDDHGGRGKSFENDLRQLLNPNTAVLKTQKVGMKDVDIKFQGKKINLEAKTGGGCLNESILFGDDWRNEIDLNEAFKFDYIAYCFEYEGTTESLLTDTIIFSKPAFIKWLNGYRKGALGLLTYKSKECRLMLANPRGSKVIRSYYEDLVNEFGNEGVYELEEFMALMK